MDHFTIPALKFLSAANLISQCKLKGKPDKLLVALWMGESKPRIARREKMAALNGLIYDFIFIGEGKAVRKMLTK